MKMTESITFKEYTYLMNRVAYWILNNNDLSRIKFRGLYSYFGEVADLQTLITYIRNKGTSLYMDDSIVSEFVECLIYDNEDLGFLPNYVTANDGTKYYTNTIISMANRVSAYEVLNGESPNIVYLKDSNTTSSDTAVLDKFESYFGKVEYIDDALEKIQGYGYAFYFSDGYTVPETIERIANGYGANCYDSAELFYRLALEMNTKYGRNYEVQYLHVYCKVSGYDHIRLRLRSNGGDWFYRDPACVLDGGSVESNWCGTSDNILSVDPSFMFD